MKKLFSVLKLMFITMVFLPLNSCEWDGNNDENYVDIDRPSETINIKVDLSGVNQNEVIQIANGSDISYTLDSEGKKLINQKFYLDGKELSSYGGNAVTINMQPVDDQIHDLKLVMTFETGSGSLAELSGVEYYVGEFDYKIKFYQRSFPELNIKQSLENNKYLKLEWDKPKNLDVARYEIYENFSDQPIAIIYDPNETHYIDKNYNYGLKYFTVRVIPLNSINISGIEGSISPHYDFFSSDDITREITDTQMNISWKNPNPYPAKYVIVDTSDNKVIEVEEGKDKIELARPNYFPYSNLFEIYILPLNAKIEDYKLYPYANFYVSDKRLRNSYYAFDLQFWNKKTNSIVGIADNEFFSYDLFNDMVLNKSDKLPDDMYSIFYGWGDGYRLTPNGSVAIIDNQSIASVFIFKGEELFKSIYTLKDIQLRYATISDKYLFYLDYQSNFYVVDFNTKEIVDKLAVNNKIDDTKIDVSSDGRYVVLYNKPSLMKSNSWYTIYELKNEKLQKIRHVEKAVDLILFDPQNPSQIIVHDQPNQFQIIDIVSGSTLQTVTENRYLSTDPYTGNILCYTLTRDNETIYFSVYDKTLINLLYRVETASYSRIREQFILANNMIFVNSVGTGNFVLDISNSLKNK